MRALLLAAVLFASCATLPPVPPAPPVPPGGATCATACARGAALHCAWAEPTAKGTTCEAVCESFELSGMMSYGVECVTIAPSCEAAEVCGGAK